jgi:hypothetical protein
MIDIVTVYHNAKNLQQADDLWTDLCRYEDTASFAFYGHSNIENNLGFAKGCNIAAAKGTGDVIGFLNPDVKIRGPFFHFVERTLGGDVKVTGCRFGKRQVELDEWGVNQWVCGATFFVLRDWFEELGGFDEQFVWSHEETDFIRRTERKRKKVIPLDLPIEHDSPSDDARTDADYKIRHFDEAKVLYRKKWKIR